MADNNLAPRSKNKLPWYEQALPMEGRATFLPYQDTLPGSVMNQRSFALPGVVAGAVNAFTAPGRAYSGSDQSFDPAAEAANFAMTTMGGGMGASRLAPAPRGALGMFVGKTAKTWDAAAAAKAAELEKTGADATTIWQQTGTWKSPDGAWRQEIPDNTAGFRMGFDKLGPNKDNAYAASTNFPLGGAFSHPDLYRAYPDLLRTERINIGKQPAWMPDVAEAGSYKPGSMTVRSKTENKAKSITLHELQHAVQSREGFAPGGGASQFYNEALLRLVAENPRVPPSRLTKAAEDEAFAQYRALMGEAEARATQARANLTATERQNVLPEQSYDLPLHLLRAK